jgi:hydrogenase/urease accessory protein HupE
MQAHSRGVHQRAFLKRDMVFHPVNALDGIDVVLGIGSAKLKAVMPDSSFQTAVIEAPVVMAGNAIGAVTASLPCLTCHALACLEKVL